MPFFSIIIPTYNRAAELKRSVESVLSQSFTDWELIIVDDGSTDETAEVAKSFSDARVRYVYQPNQERSVSRNNGMKLATGEYICLLDSDDIFLVEHLRVLHERITIDGYPVAVYKTMMTYADKSRPDDFSYAYNGNTTEDAIKYVWNNGSQLICLCFHQSIAKEIAFPEPFFWFEDVHWLIRVVMKYPLVQIMSYTTNYLNKDSGILLKGNYNRYLNNCISCIRDLESRLGDKLKSILGRRCFDVKVAELYLGFIVAGAAKAKQLRLGYSYLLKAMGICITPRLILKYGYYSLKLFRASF